MLTNYSVNASQPSFGKYEFINNSRDILRKKITTNKDLAKLKELCKAEQEDFRANRTIIIGRTLRNGCYSGNRLAANVGDGRWRSQGFFQSALSFLKEMTHKADKFQIKQNKKLEINDYLDKL